MVASLRAVDWWKAGIEAKRHTLTLIESAILWLQMRAATAALHEDSLAVDTFQLTVDPYHERFQFSGEVQNFTGEGGK